MMNIISHRGNINGKIVDKENSPNYIDAAIRSGYQVEVDVRFAYGCFWLGHDTRQYKITKSWIIKRCNDIWYHCKNLDAAIELKKMNANIKYFCHAKDSYVITSTFHFWVHDLKLKLNNDCIIPLLSKKSVLNYQEQNVYAVCTDYADLYTSKLNNAMSR